MQEQFVQMAGEYAGARRAALRKVRVYEKRLERERERLGRLIDATMDEPIALNEEILEQSKKVDALIALVQEMGEGGIEGREHG